MKLSGGAYLNVRSGLLASLALVLTSIMFGLMACANPVYHDGAMQVGARRYPGEFIDVGGYKLFVSCSGAGPYTVVFETGGGGVHLLGLRVQKRLRADPDFQVCSYDRAGHGWSESASGPYELEAELDALRRILDARHIQDRLILVGASYGGFFIKSFAAKYPSGVIGLVYLDANSLYFFDQHPDIVRKLETATVPLVLSPGSRRVGWSNGSCGNRWEIGSSMWMKTMPKRSSR